MREGLGRVVRSVRRAPAVSLVWFAFLLCVIALGLAIAGQVGTSDPVPSAVISSTAGNRVALTPIEGGPTYFANLSPKSAWLDSHILLGAWLEQPENATEVGYDAAMGENIYWSLGARPGVSGTVDYNVIRAGGMHIEAPSEDANTGSETVGFHGSDEADLDYGPGSNRWANNGTYNPSACVAFRACGYTAAKFYFSGNRTDVTGAPLPYTIDGREVSQGLGKGVLFFETNSQAAPFLKYSDILSADDYWLTDQHNLNWVNGACDLAPSSSACGGGRGPGLNRAQAELPANYYWNVTRLATLQARNGPSKPIVMDVETGCPGSNGTCATPASSTAAAWQALIAGARGIIWFQHDFSFAGGGSPDGCDGVTADFRTFIDGSNPSSPMYNCQQSPGVTLHDVVVAITAFDRKVQSLNGVLLSPTAHGYVNTTGDVDTMAKAHNGFCYVFAGSGKPATPPQNNQKVTFRLADGYSGPITVYDENRTLKAANGVFQDTFANKDSVHIYAIADNAVCPARLSQSSTRPGPKLTDLAIIPPRFRTSPDAGPAQPTTYGATVRYRSTGSARATFVVERISVGRRHNGVCLATHRDRERARRCARVTVIPGLLRHKARQGRNQFRFSGWIKGQRLVPGLYDTLAIPDRILANSSVAAFHISR